MSHYSLQRLMQPRQYTYQTQTVIHDTDIMYSHSDVVATLKARFPICCTLQSVVSSVVMSLLY